VGLIFSDSEVDSGPVSELPFRTTETGDACPDVGGEDTRLLLLRGILRGGMSSRSSTGETSVTRPVAPFHSGFSEGAVRLFNFRTRSPNDVLLLAGPVMVVSGPRLTGRSAGAVNCPGLTD
jgi:hypothetical protein